MLVLPHETSQIVKTMSRFSEALSGVLGFSVYQLWRYDLMKNTVFLRQVSTQVSISMADYFLGSTENADTIT